MAGFTDFKSQEDVANLLNIIQGNALLNELYTTFLNALGKIVPGGGKSGTHASRGVITIQSSWLPSQGSSLSYTQIAAILAHELAHQVLPGGNSYELGQVANPAAVRKPGPTIGRTLPGGLDQTKERLEKVPCAHSGT